MVAFTDGASLWKTGDYLLAVVADALHGANWQRGNGKGRKPQRIPRPGMPDGNDRLGGGTKYTADELDELLAAEWVDVDEGGA